MGIGRRQRRENRSKKKVSFFAAGRLNTGHLRPAEVVLKRKSAYPYGRTTYSVKRRHLFPLPRNSKTLPWYFEMICEALFRALCFVSGRQWASPYLTMSSPARIQISQRARHTFYSGPSQFACDFWMLLFLSLPSSAASPSISH